MSEFDCFVLEGFPGGVGDWEEFVVWDSYIFGDPFGRRPLFCHQLAQFS